MAHFHNNALIGSGGQGAGDHQIDRSLRFEKDNNSYLNRTPSSAGNRRTWTWSGWVKRAGNDSDHHLFVADKDPSASLGNSTFGRFYIESGGAIRYSGYTAAYRTTTQVLRDQSAWYHIVLAVDTTQATDDDRIKIYLNGSQITDFDTKNNPTQNFDLAFNQTTPHTIGARSRSGTIAHWLSGYLTEIHFVDGQQLAPSDFGEFDDNNVWQPKDCKDDLTYGTNGFYLKFDDNSSVAALGTDSSGNSNTWTPNGFSVGTSYPFSAEFDGTTSQYIRKAGSGILPGNTGTGTFTIECHFFPHTNSVIGLFDGGSGETNIIRNYDANAIGKQGGPTVDITGDYTVGDWNHMAAVYDGSADVLTVYINGTSSGTGSFSSYTGGNNFDIGTINTGGDGKFNGLIRNFRVTNNVVYSSNFTAPSHSVNLTNISGTQLLLFTTDANGLLTDGSSQGHTLTNNGGVREYNPGADNDSLIDTPTNYVADSGNNGGNYAVLNPLAANSNVSLTDGNLTFTKSNSGWDNARSTIGMSSGKWYCEIQLVTGTFCHCGIIKDATGPDQFVGQDATSWGYSQDGGKYNNSVRTTPYGDTFTTGDLIGVAFDADGGNLYFYKNGVAQNSGTAAYTGLTDGPYFFATSASGSSQVHVFNAGQRPFTYTPPTGYVSLCTQNLADPTIADGSTAFDVVTYTGNNTTHVISTSFSADFIWTKVRNDTYRNYLLDIVRGGSGLLHSDRDLAENTTTQIISNFGSSSYTLTNDPGVNQITKNYVAWYWDGGTSTVSNTDGSITSSVRANQSAGFSIVTWTAAANNPNRIGHGLNATPEFIFVKSRTNANNWRVYTAVTGKDKYLGLNSNSAASSFSNFWSNSEPNSSTFGVWHATGAANNDGDMVGYCFAPLEGYSAFGSYEGNGSATDGPFVYTGMRPKFILAKIISGNTDDWIIYDTERSSFNAADDELYPNQSSAETSGNRPVDILSNGFKIRNNSNKWNGASGYEYVYAAFAEHPLKTARAR